MVIVIRLLTSTTRPLWTKCFHPAHRSHCSAEDPAHLAFLAAGWLIAVVFRPHSAACLARDVFVSFHFPPVVRRLVAAAGPGTQEIVGSLTRDEAGRVSVAATAINISPLIWAVRPIGQDARNQIRKARVSVTPEIKIVLLGRSPVQVQ